MLIAEYLCKLEHSNSSESKSNILTLLRLMSSLCVSKINAKTVLSNGALSTLYPFLFVKSRDGDIKAVGQQLLCNILRFGMKEIVGGQAQELYKFNETHSKIFIKKN